MKPLHTKEILVVASNTVPIVAERTRGLRLTVLAGCMFFIWPFGEKSSSRSGKC